MKTRRSRKWCGQAIDRLESRRTPSLGAAAVAGLGPPADVPASIQPQLATTPADGSTYEAADAPSALVFDLGGPADLLWSDGGVELRRVEGDGSESVVVRSDDWPSAAVGPGETVTLPLPAKLDPGRYRIVLLGGGSLAFAYSRGRWDPTADRTAAEFQVKPPAASADLGVAGPGVVAATGVLDRPTDFDAYRIRLADGQALWRLAVQVDAGRIGSGLIAGVGVYDAAGREVASARAGSHHPSDFPNDPYLFAGLPPGDYVVVVSKSAGSAGGGYRLELAADPVTGPTRVSSFTPDRSAGGAAGFTIGFTSPIDPARLRSDSVYVVDGSGSKHAVRLASVGAGLTSARFEFLGPIPSGDYRLVVGGDAPLADLIGRIPVAGRLPAGTLASWSVSAAQAGPKVAPSDALASGSLRLAAGAVREIPIVLGADEWLVLNARLASGAARVELVGGPRGTSVVADGDPSRGIEMLIRPGAGDYVLRIVSAGGTTTSGTWALRRAVMSDESLVAAAVGSRGAIGLRLAEGEATSPPSGPPAPIAPSESTTGGAAAARSSGDAARAAAAARSELGPSPWAYGAGSALVGRPSSTADAVAPVGPAAPGGLSAVAWAGPGTSVTGASLVLSAEPQADDGLPRSPSGSIEAVAAPPAADGQVVLATADADDGALERAERVAEAVLGGLRWLLDRPEGAPPPAVDVDVDVDAAALARAEAAGRGADGSGGQVQRSALDLPFTVLLVTASTFHLRRATRRWWDGRKLRAEAAAQARPAGPRPLFRGPRSLTAGRAGARVDGPRRG